MSFPVSKKAWFRNKLKSDCFITHSGSSNTYQFAKVKNGEFTERRCLSEDEALKMIAKQKLVGRKDTVLVRFSTYRKAKSWKVIDKMLSKG